MRRRRVRFAFDRSGLEPVAVAQREGEHVLVLVDTEKVVDALHRSDGAASAARRREPAPAVAPLAAPAARAAAAPAAKSRSKRCAPPPGCRRHCRRRAAVGRGRADADGRLTKAVNSSRSSVASSGRPQLELVAADRAHAHVDLARRRSCRLPRARRQALRLEEGLRQHVDGAFGTAVREQADAPGFDQLAQALYGALPIDAKIDAPPDQLGDADRRRQGHQASRWWSLRSATINPLSGARRAVDAQCGPSRPGAAAERVSPCSLRPESARRRPTAAPSRWSTAHRGANRHPSPDLRPERPRGRLRQKRRSPRATRDAGAPARRAARACSFTALCQRLVAVGGRNLAAALARLDTPVVLLDMELGDHVPGGDIGLRPKDSASLVVRRGTLRTQRSRSAPRRRPPPGQRSRSDLQNRSHPAPACRCSACRSRAPPASGSSPAIHASSWRRCADCSGSTNTGRSILRP